MPKKQALERTGKYKSKEEAQKDTSKSCNLHGILQCLYNSFCSQDCSGGHSGHGQDCQQHSSNGSSAQGAMMPQQTGICKSCGKQGCWAQDCRTYFLEGFAASVSKLKPSGKKKAQ